MRIQDAQREMRYVFLGGYVGQLVSGAIWALAAAAGTWIAPVTGMAVLFFGSMFIYPLTQLGLRIRGGPYTLSPQNTLAQLATQIAFTVPVGFLLVAAATLYRQTWFFPASMVIVGAHYLPFVFLYGMWHFAGLGAALVAGGAALALYGPDAFGLGGWLGAAALIVAAFVGRGAVRREQRVGAPPAE